ncbi:glycerophosphodiester phosphodiesterase family protein [Desertivirga brevis]|uniref:glycerophosphodiester phosphodiesterase family protein n=1 Tax=Desertivirga brevis TaxID=2810310 RepID=UPI001F604F15|nr:glycerophosphodiester phosphodiesterase family protein [Pedobacter sp. SYSU D00873]
MEIKSTLPRFSREAHRGGRGLVPENTIPAMLNALNRNITTLEMDCQITADNKVIVSHDAKINPQFSLTESGKEISPEEAESLVFYQMNYDQIRKFDVGLKVNQKFPRQEKIKTYIPLLSDLIDSVQNDIKLNKRKQVFYNIETKISPEGDNKLHPEPEKFVNLLMDVIKQKGIGQWVIIQSFDPRTLEIVHSKYPGTKTSFLTSTGNLSENLNRLSFIPDVYSPAYKLVDQQLIKGCHEKGLKVIPWTVNEKAKIDELTKMGTDGIITDFPNLF